MTQIKFSYDGLSGSRSVIGPILIFKIRARYVSQHTDPTDVLFTVKKAELSIPQRNTAVPVGDLDPRPALGHITLRTGGERVIDLMIQLSPGSFQRFLEESASKIFQIILYTSEPIDANPQAVTPSVFLALSRTEANYVTGKIDGIENVQQFKVDSDAWIKAVNDTRSADYLADTILVMNTDRKYVKELSIVIKKAEDLLNEGKIQQSIQKTREICEWAGYKPKSESSRYHTLNSFSLSSDEKEGLKYVLDSLWNWSSVGHHDNPAGSKSFTEEQARMCIHIAYYMLSYLSRKELVSEV